MFCFVLFVLFVENKTKYSSEALGFNSCAREHMLNGHFNPKYVFFFYLIRKYTKKNPLNLIICIFFFFAALCIQVGLICPPSITRSRISVLSYPRIRFLYIEYFFCFVLINSFLSGFVSFHFVRFSLYFWLFCFAVTTSNYV